MSFSNVDFVLPSQAQASLALAIIKLKPQGLSIRDHMQQIRQHIKPGSRPPESPRNTPTPQTIHLDSASFWKAAYSRSEAEVTRLQDQIYDLEQKVEVMQGKASVAAEVTASVVLGKRKAIALKGEMNGQKGKRAKTMVCESKGRLGAGTVLVDGVVDDNGMVGEDMQTSFLSRFFKMQSVLQQKFDADSITASTIVFCNAAEKLCDLPVLRGNLKEQAKRTTTTKQRLTSLERTFPFVLQALKRVSSAQKEKTTPMVGNIVYHFVHMYSKLVEQLHIQSLEYAQLQDRNQKYAKRKSTTASSKPVKDSGKEILGQLSQLLLTMFAALDPASRQEHTSLAEGFAYFFLAHTGKILSWAIFDEGSAVGHLTARNQVSEMPLPQMLDGLRGATIKPAVFREAVKLESRHVVWLLARIMPLVRAMKLRKGLGDASETDSTQIKFDTFQVLQSTLLKGVFGPNDPTFRASLSEPKKPEPFLSGGSTGDEDTMGHNNWFVGEVWKLLGWDVLVQSVERDVETRVKENARKLVGNDAGDERESEAGNEGDRATEL